MTTTDKRLPVAVIYLTSAGGVRLLKVPFAAAHSIPPDVSCVIASR